jgi:acyl carrier protein
MPEVSSSLNIVKEYILKEFLPGEDASNLTATTPLMTTGILDSLATLKLITFLEATFKVQIEAYEADEEHFNTLEAICALLDSKR